MNFNTSRIISRAGGAASLLAAHLSLPVPLVPDNWRLYAEYKHCSISVVPFIVPLNNLARLSRVGASVTRCATSKQYGKSTRWKRKKAFARVGMRREGNWNGSFQRGTGCFGFLGRFNPCSWHRSERFFLFWGGKGRRIIKIERVELILFKKKVKKKQDKTRVSWINSF